MMEKIKRFVRALALFIKLYVLKFYNHFIKRTRISPKGEKLKIYLENIINGTEELNNHDYESQMFEDSISKIMKDYNCDREHAVYVLYLALAAT